MNNENAAQAYLRASVENSPPIKIVRMLYTGALRFVRQAMESDTAGDAGAFLANLKRLDAIVCELRCSLNFEDGGQIAEQLDRLYEFVESRVAQAVVERNGQLLRPVENILTKLLDAWNQVDVCAQESAA